MNKLETTQMNNKIIISIPNLISNISLKMISYIWPTEEKKEVNEDNKPKFTIIFDKKLGRYTKDSIIQFYDYIVRDNIKQMTTMVQTNRAKRRKIFDNITKYIELFEDYTESVEQFYEKKRNEFFDKLSINKHKWFQSQKYYSEQEIDFLATVTNMPLKFKKYISSNKSIKKNELRDVLRYQLQCIKQIEKSLNNFRSQLTDPSDLVYFTELRIEDMTYFKFQLEEEDYFHLLEDIMNLASDNHNITREEEEICQLFIEKMDFYNISCGF